MTFGEYLPHFVQARQQASGGPQEFTGVPLFHAEGLTVQTKDGPLTPLFFSRRDLDKAVRDNQSVLHEHTALSISSNSLRLLPRASQRNHL